ncbi:lipopolysaccharide-induced tumor necrosis factor-alpha factor homolog isoform X4 [Eupeodes corollae]|uniref:lipopolysaccharide-induced tumor necrosis factor-alpha factor homolog isoform X4 n=1 Tax=Eupeodes corollae TaxID=290404 RepID=UPI002491C99E|nr:lipopolysaccharide-induced tumor necrosis factor-alpha factor homolog isoform X4 [Eupeodes corollae]
MEKSKEPPKYSDPPPGWTPAKNYEAEMEQPIVYTVAQPPVGPTPCRMVCPSCRADILTDLKRESTTKTHLMAVLMFVLFCWPCVCLPYCMDSCQNANHYCPNCNAFIGTYQS